MARSNFPVYFSMRRMMAALRDDQLGRVLRAALDFAELGKDPTDLDQAERIAYEAMRDTIQRDCAKYDAKCRQNKANGAKGGRPPKYSEKPDGFAPNPAEPDAAFALSTAAATPTARPTATATAADTASHRLLLPPNTPEAFFSENFTPITPHYKRQLSGFRRQGCAEDLLFCAMREALDHNAPRWCYVRRILERCVADGILTAEAYQKSRPATGGGHNIRVDRAQPSGNDFLQNAVNRPHRLKRGAA